MFSVTIYLIKIYQTILEVFFFFLVFQILFSAFSVLSYLAFDFKSI